MVRFFINNTVCDIRVKMFKNFPIYSITVNYCQQFQWMVWLYEFYFDWTQDCQCFESDHWPCARFQPPWTLDLSQLCNFYCTNKFNEQIGHLSRWEWMQSQVTIRKNEDGLTVDNTNKFPFRKIPIQSLILVEVHEVHEVRYLPVNHRRLRLSFPLILKGKDSVLCLDTNLDTFLNWDQSCCPLTSNSLH